ncbi:MAG TPA: amino acid adenylation domain-containing protein, partial [Ramlibacter sp.]|nr:amino acid adenylation domain-containing protein [Ramlibacter sp.]
MSSENLAYVIYTSGSSGQPKGTLIAHANVVRLFAATREWFAFDERDVWTLFHSYAFDFSVWEMWGALLHGGRLVLVPLWVSRAAEQFYELLWRQEVTVLNQTPSAFYQLQQHEEALAERAELALRLVIFGGEALDVRRLRPWVERHGEQRPQLVNMYGITETTVHVTYRRLQAADLQEAGGSLIGGALPDLGLYILGPQQQLVPLGTAGEVCISGAGLSRGYLNRAGLTGSKFIPDPFSKQPGARLYRSGDLGRRLAGGEVEYLGRLDQQVKVRGFRIELGEIEAVLQEHVEVREVLVLLREDGAGEGRLVCYVVLQPGGAISSSELYGYASNKLPAYMVPSAFIMLESFPLTANGKVDRGALPAAHQERPELKESYAGAETLVEEILVGIWSEILQLPKVGVRDDFFELGGHSLLATQVISRVRQAFTIELPLRTLFEAPTIRALAQQVETALR